MMSLPSRTVIHCAADLGELAGKKKLRWLPQREAQIAVELPWLLPHERETWSNILTRDFYQCGCSHGAAFLLAGCLVLLVRFITRGFQPLGAWYLVVGPLLLIALSGFGKAFGILWSGVRFRRSVSLLLAMSYSQSALSRQSSSASRELCASPADSARKQNA